MSNRGMEFSSFVWALSEAALFWWRCFICHSCLLPVQMVLVVIVLLLLAFLLIAPLLMVPLFAVPELIQPFSCASLPHWARV
jgi:hypothetical protein